MSKRLMPMLAVALSAVAGTAFTVGRGGWAVITVEDLPEHLVAGKPTELTFVVRQHGMTLLSGLRPTVFAKSGSAQVQASAIPGKKSGSYSSTIVVPSAGEWTLTIASGFMNNNIALAPMPAIAAGTAAPRVIAAADRGKQLYIAKGCTTCHVHAAVEASGKVKAGPDLTPKRYQAEYLAKLLDDPTIARTPGQMNTMPKLELRPVEVAAITAFINADRQVSTRQ
jgi:mono/diheme cytochrome c family protein